MAPINSAMRDFSTLAQYGNLAANIAVFLLDDTLIFVIAMLTLRSVAATGITGAGALCCWRWERS